MNTPNNLSQAKAFQSNPKRVVSFLLVGLALVLALAITMTFNRLMESESVAEANPEEVSYSNALEMRYAQPWLDAQNKAAIPFNDALEIQYAQTWLDAQNKAAIPYSNALEIQYAQPWLDAQKSFDCHSRLDLFYACQNR